MKFISYDDHQSMALFGMPITLVSCNDNWSTTDDDFFYPDPFIEPFRYGNYNNDVYEPTCFTSEHIDIALKIGEQLTKRFVLKRHLCCPYHLRYNEFYAVITRNKLFKQKEKKLKIFLIESPVILFEILPPNAKKGGQMNKFAQYHHCPTLEVCILFSQDEPYVEMYRKTTNWKQECISANESIVLDLLKLELPLTSIYASVF